MTAVNKPNAINDLKKMENASSLASTSIAAPPKNFINSITDEAKNHKDSASKSASGSSSSQTGAAINMAPNGVNRVSSSSNVTNKTADLSYLKMGSIFGNGHKGSEQSNLNAMGKRQFIA